MTKTLLCISLFVLTFNAVGKADDKTDRERRVRIALALSNPAPVSISPVVAPPPRMAAFETVKKLSYLDGYKIATAERKPLLVFVGCDSNLMTPKSAIVTTTDTFGDYPPKTILVIYARNGVAHVHKTFTCPADSEDLKKAVDDAAKFLESAVKTSVSPCICGDSCKCKTGDCPGKCPVLSVPCNQ